MKQETTVRNIYATTKMRSIEKRDDEVRTQSNGFILHGNRNITRPEKVIQEITNQL